MSMLVLIRNIEEMDTALEAANKYVIFMQKLFDSNQQENWILGVWVRSEFETDLPYLSCQNQKSTGTVIDESSESNVITLKKPVYIQQSVSLCGIYSFFWVNGDLFSRYGRAGGTKMRHYPNSNNSGFAGKIIIFSCAPTKGVDKNISIRYEQPLQTTSKPYCYYWVCG